jgi:hypothetical protein
MGAQIQNPDDIFRYVMAGRATLTLVSRTSGLRFTYRVESKYVRPDENETPEQFAARQREAFAGARFVKVLTGPDNTRNYTYLGHINAQHQFRSDKQSKVGEDAASFRAWAWFWDVLMRRLPKLDQLEVWHNGRCSRCGRALTVPESVSSGLGPVCAEEIGTAFHTGIPTHTTSALRAAATASRAASKIPPIPTEPLTFRNYQERSVEVSR